MSASDDQRRELEAELTRVYGGSSHVSLAFDPGIPWPADEVARALQVLRSMPNGAGEAAVIRALGVSADDVERWDEHS